MLNRTFQRDFTEEGKKMVNWNEWEIKENISYELHVICL